MKEINIDTRIRVYSMDELPEDAKRLIEKAINATANSYAPYSKFHVGAAIRLEDGTEFIGANQENAAFPVTLCAERTAIFAAQAQHPELAIKELAIAASNENGLTESPISPCGSCRQVILEMEQRYGSPVHIYLYGTACVYVIDSVKDLLPLCFVDESMR